MTGRTPSPVGARVKFRDDHPQYAGMVGTVEEILDLGIGKVWASVRLDAVAADADEIEPWSDDA